MAPVVPPRIPGWLIEKLKHPLVVAGAVKLGVSVGQEASRLRRGEVSFKEFRAQIGRHVGGMTGTATGVALGAWAGSVVPGVGTVLGAFGGGLAGQMLGEMATTGVERSKAADEASEDDEATGPEAEPENDAEQLDVGT